MGMYTELVFKAVIKRDTPDNVRKILEFLFDPNKNHDLSDLELPDHHFFSLNFWDFIGRSDSFYHHPSCVNSFHGNYIFSRSDLKNYGNEIDSFVDWVSPYIDGVEGDCIGWEWYEEWNEPTLLYKSEKDD